MLQVPCFEFQSVRELVKYCCNSFLAWKELQERSTNQTHTRKHYPFPSHRAPKNHTKNLTWLPWPSLNVTWSIEGSLSPACVRERVKSLPHASSLKSNRWPLKEEASSCARLETASKSLDVDQSYGGWPALQHPPKIQSCNIEMGHKNRSKTNPSTSQSWQTAKCVANKRLEQLLNEVAWLHDVSRAQAHARKLGAKVARFRAPDSTDCFDLQGLISAVLVLRHAGHKNLCPTWMPYTCGTGVKALCHARVLKSPWWWALHKGWQEWHPQSKVLNKCASTQGANWGKK